MTIGYIFSYLGDGGAEENAILLAKQARKVGFRALFIVSKASEIATKKLQDNNIDIINLPMESSFNIVSVRLSAAGLKKIIQTEKIDIIHAHMLREQSVAVLAKLLGSKFKLVRTFHRFDQFNLKMKPLMSAYRRFTDAFISISDQMTKYMKANGLTQNVYLIKNGVDKVVVAKHQQAIGYMGRLSSEKGIFKFIKANVEVLKKSKFVVAGDGPEFAEIKQFVIENNLNVELIGKVIDKSKFYSNISVLVLPSDTEVLPLVVLEAYSCGLPVVAFNLESLVGLIENNNGRLIEYPRYDQMGLEAVKLISRSGDFLKANIAKYEAEYSTKQMWQKTDALYRHLAEVGKK